MFICYILLGDHYHHNLFSKCQFLPHLARVRHLSRNETSPHIPENCPFRLQTKQFHFIDTFFSSLFAPIHTLLSSISTFIQAETQSSTLLRSRCPNHLNSPCLAPQLNSEFSKDYKISLHFLSFKGIPHIHLTIIGSVHFKLCRFPAFSAHVSVPYVNTLWTQALYMFPFK